MFRNWQSFFKIPLSSNDFREAVVKEYIVEMEKFNDKNKNMVFKAGKKQILLIGVNNRIFALDNRCPHEGYPLSEGGVNESCVLTCNWHNWKFDLETGECTLGGDNVVTYPVQVVKDKIHVDISGPSKDNVRDSILKGFQVAFEKRQYGRLAREITRLDFNEIDPICALKKAIFWSYDKFEYGMTHAYAACADWVSLYMEVDPDEAKEREKRIVYLTETIDHIAYDALRHKEYPFHDGEIPFNEGQFINAIEKEDEKTAISLINGAISEGLTFKDLEKVFTEAALAHYNDFGHSLIYVYKASTLSSSLKDPEVDACLFKALTRSLINTTREDLIPEFKDYQPALIELSKQSFGDKKDELSFTDLKGKRVKAALNWVLDKSKVYSEENVYRCLLLAQAHNMMTYDLNYQAATNNPVTQNVGWLDFTHALTFSNAVRALCSKYPEYWGRGLLQMSCFYGRNTFFTSPEIDPSQFEIKETKTFERDVLDKILDHGMALPIYSAHLLKTSKAIFEEGAFLNQVEKCELYSSLNRFLSSPLKAKHVRRMAKQAINLVAKDF